MSKFLKVQNPIDFVVCTHVHTHTCIVWGKFHLVLDWWSLSKWDWILNTLKPTSSCTKIFKSFEVGNVKNNMKSRKY